MLVIAKEDVAIFKFIAFCSLITIQYNTDSISNVPPTSTVDRVQFTVQFWSSAVNKNVFSLCLNSGVECVLVPLVVCFRLGSSNREGCVPELATCTWHNGS